MNLEQSQKEGLEEMSKHEPNCPKSGDIMEECTCPQQSTVEERKDKLYEMFAEFEIRPLVADFIKVHKYMESELQLAEQKAREEERYRIVDIIEKHKENIKEPCVCVPGEENCHVCQSKYHDDDLQDIINQITNSK
jgi:hypothetical protein